LSTALTFRRRTPEIKVKFFVYTAVFDQYRDNKRKNFLYSVNNPDFRASGEK